MTASPLKFCSASKCNHSCAILRMPLFGVNALCSARENVAVYPTYRKFKHPFSLTRAIAPNRLVINRTIVWRKSRCCGQSSGPVAARGGLGVELRIVYGDAARAARRALWRGNRDRFRRQSRRGRRRVRQESCPTDRRSSSGRGIRSSWRSCRTDRRR